eukprot:COSAG01_NODE_3761_length_5722_cov_2.962298_1_plen_58_part_10
MFSSGNVSEKARIARLDAGGEVSDSLAFLACIGSPCLRQCVHGASIGGDEKYGGGGSG